MKKIVIGAGYGDEGKGLIVDYFVEKLNNPLVVRFNGGPQAAHTVVRNGIRHVFGSFGSGTLQGAPTFFDKHTLISPTLINQESRVLGNNPTLYVHPEAKVITPYDVLWNHYTSAIRGDFSSCGVGIFASITRDKEISVRAGDSILDKEAEIREYYLNKLHNENSDSRFTERFIAILRSKNDIWNEFITEAEVCDCEISEFPSGYENIVFEGAQGLLLDEKYGEMPYCTPSNTGIENVKEYIDSDTEIVYVSRCYSTRHGGGPLEGECDPKYLGNKVHDITNVANEFQGNMRYAPLNMVKLFDVIGRDSEIFDSSLAITCLDQVNEIHTLGGKYTIEEFLEHCIPDYESYGPTAETIKSN